MIMVLAKGISMPFFDDRRRHQRVQFMADELHQTRPSSSRSFICPWADADARFGHQPLNQFGDREDRIDAIVARKKT